MRILLLLPCLLLACTSDPPHEAPQGSRAPAGPPGAALPAFDSLAELKSHAEHSAFGGGRLVELNWAGGTIHVADRHPTSGRRSSEATIYVERGQRFLPVYRFPTLLGAWRRWSVAGSRLQAQILVDGRPGLLQESIPLELLVTR